MRSSYLQAASIALGLGVAVAMAAPPSPAIAQGQRGKEKGETARESVRKAVTEAQKLDQNNDIEGAFKILKDIDAQVTDKNGLEEVTIAQMLAIVAVKNKDYETATTAVNRALASPQLPPETRAAFLKVALPLNFQAKEYDKTIQLAQELQKSEPLTDTYALYLVEAYYFKDDHANALSAGQALLSALQAAGKQPDKVLLQIVRSTQVNSGDQAGALKTLELEARYYNAPDAWEAITNQAITQTKSISEHMALQIFRLKYARNAMTPEDYTQFVSFANKFALYTEAVNAADKGNVSSAAATEAKSKRPGEQKNLLELEAAVKKATTGEASVRLGETYWTLGRNADAEAAIRAGIAKGKVDDINDSRLMLAIVLLSSGKKDEALQILKELESTPIGPIAHVWAVHAETPAA